MRGEIIGVYHKTNKEASTVLCSVVKHLGSSRALKKWGKTLDFVSCFPLHFCRALPLPASFTTEQSTVKASLFVKQLLGKRSEKETLLTNFHSIGKFLKFFNYYLVQGTLNEVK